MHPNEHDDDLEPQVHEGVEGETDAYPDTEEEFDEAVSDETEDDDELNRDDDESEL